MCINCYEYTKDERMRYFHFKERTIKIIYDLYCSLYIYIYTVQSSLHPKGAAPISSGLQVFRVEVPPFVKIARAEDVPTWEHQSARSVQSGGK